MIVDGISILSPLPPPLHHVSGELDCVPFACGLRRRTPLSVTGEGTMVGEDAPSALAAPRSPSTVPVSPPGGALFAACWTALANRRDARNPDAGRAAAAASGASKSTPLLPADACVVLAPGGVPSPAGLGLRAWRPMPAPAPSSSLVPLRESARSPLAAAAPTAAPTPPSSVSRSPSRST